MVCQSRVRVSHSNSTMRTLKEAVASSRDFSVVWRRILQWTGDSALAWNENDRIDGASPFQMDLVGVSRHCISC